MSELPATSNAPSSSASESTRANACATRSRGTFSPKNTTSGFSTPPQPVHSASRKFATSVSTRRRRPRAVSTCAPARAAVKARSFQLAQPLLQLVAGADPAAAEADDVRDAAVQIDHGVAAGGAVQTVDVLRDHAAQHLGGLQGDERPVATVGQGPGHAGPADVAARPVTALCGRPGDELGVGHRLARGRRRPAVVRDAGVGRQAGAGQGDERTVGEDVEGGVDRVHPGLHGREHHASSLRAPRRCRARVRAGRGR